MRFLTQHFVLSCILAAQISVTIGQIPDMHFETISTKDGLPSNTVFTASKDREGFMWFGTRLCPVRYDGTTFQSFRTPITNLVSGVAIDKNNTVWVSSDKSGICRINAQRSEMVPLQQTSTGSTGDFYIDQQGFGWYSDFHGVNKLNLQTHHVVHYSFRSTSFLWNKASFLEDSSKTLWVIGRDNGLFRYDAKKDTLICMLGKDCQNPDRADSILFSKGSVDHEGILWIGSFNRGLIRYDPRSNDYEVLPTTRISNQVTAIMEGKDENGKRILWIGDDQGIGIFRPEQKRFYFFSEVFAEAFVVHNFFNDPELQIVWICTSGGIVKYHPMSNMIKTVRIPEKIVPSSAVVTSFLQAKSDATTYYVGLSNTGIVKWNSITNEFKLIAFPATPAETRWITERDDGTIWIGTNRWDYTRPGIFVYNPKKDRFITSKLSILANTYFSVPFFMYGQFDKNDRLWIGNSDEGIHVLDDHTNSEVTPWADTTQQTFLRGNNLVNSICFDGNGRVLVGAYKGIFQIDEEKGKFNLIDSMNKPLSSMAVNSLLIDRDERIWAARWGSLTGSAPTGTIQTELTTDDGFYDHENRGLALDYHGNLWIGNYEGVYCFMPSNKQLIRFTSNDGLMNNNTTHSMIASRDGKLLFIGQKNGFNIIRADKLLSAQTAPSLAVSSFKVRGVPYKAKFSEPISLNRSDNAFTVDFIALNYRKQHDNRYAYFLEGLEDDWNYSGTEHQASYTNLNPGEYLLHIKTSDAFGNWSSKIVDLQIQVLPAFYETWWFKTSMVLLALSILYGLYRYRISQLLKMQYVRNRISADLHDQLGSSLSGISIMGALAQKTMAEHHPSTPFISRIMEEVQQISDSLDDIVWNISPKNDGLKNILARMTRYASELFEAKQIKYQFTQPPTDDGIRLSMEQRRNFYLIFKEAVNNLVKHSQCTNAFIDIKISNKKLVFTIQDNGIGFNVDAQSDRNGLSNIRDRVKALRGTLKLESFPGKTSIELRFTLRE